MQEEQNVLFKLPTERDTKNLGYSFGANFLSPLFGQQPYSNGSVIAFYGLACTGKSIFMQGLYGSFHKAMDELFSRGLLKSAALVEGRMFRQMDQGYYTYPASPRYFEEGPGASPRSAWFKKDCLFAVRPVLGQPGFDLIEHASLPHLRRADVTIVCARETVFLRKERACYFDRLRMSLNHAKPGLATDEIKEIATLQGQMKQIEQALGEIEQSSESQGDENRSLHLINVALTRPNEALARSFQAFRKDAAMNPYRL